jgi:hypothetical protein
MPPLLAVVPRPHSTPPSDRKRVSYLFHPWFGREIYRRGRQLGRGVITWDCLLEWESRRALEIPDRMFDPARGEPIRIRELPSVDQPRRRPSTNKLTASDALPPTGKDPCSKIIPFATMGILVHRFDARVWTDFAPQWFSPNRTGSGSPIVTDGHATPSIRCSCSKNSNATVARPSSPISRLGRSPESTTVANSQWTPIAARPRRGRLHQWQSDQMLPWTRPPCGYRADPDRPRDPAGVRVDPTEAALVGDRFRWYADEGISFMALVQRRRDLGVRSPSGNECGGMAEVPRLWWSRS